MTQGQALSPLDAVFLRIESGNTPMQMASVGIFEGSPLRDADGNLRMADLRRLISSRLELVPKLRQKACSGLLGEAPPSWVDDPEFSIEDHVRLHRLPPAGSEDDLRWYCGELMSVPLERVRPLWELTFVDGLADGRIAIIERLHHSMADGLAAAELATVLLDLSPVTPAPEQESPWVPIDPLPAWRAATDDLLRLAGLSVRVAAWGAQTVQHPIRRLRELGQFGRALGTLATPRTIAPRSSINATISSSRSVEFIRLPFEQVHGVAHRWDATINDVLLTVVAGGMHELLKGRGELTESSELQALVPVGLVHAEKRGLVNSVSALLVRLPVGEEDPLIVLRRVSADVQHQKDHHQELAAGTLLDLLEPVPQGVLASVAGIVQHQPFFNLIVTNVPGPSVPLFALGAKLEEAFPIVPLIGNQSLAVAALSYEGQLNLGVLSDPRSCPDVELFCEGVRTSLAQLIEESTRADFT